MPGRCIISGCAPDGTLVHSSSEAGPSRRESRPMALLDRCIQTREDHLTGVSLLVEPGHPMKLQLENEDLQEQ